MTETLETVTKKKPEPTAEQLGHQKYTPAGNEEMQSWRARPLDEVYAAVFIGAIDGNHPPLDPAADIALDLGRDIPSRVRDWALTAEPPSGSDPAVPAWGPGRVAPVPGVRAPQPSVSVGTRLIDEKTQVT